MDKYKKKVTLNNTGLVDSLFIRHNAKTKLSLRAFRWLSVFLITMLFVLSYHADIQMLEGTLVGSRFIGFHLIDPTVFLQYMFASHMFPVNLVIGTFTIVFFYLIFGRAFCSWVCPYGLISELGEKLNNILVTKKIVKPHTPPKYMNAVFFALFMLLSFATGYLIFETINPVGIISRVILYGTWGSIVILVLIFMLEILVGRRIWCRAVCPVGFVYGLLNIVSAVKVHYGTDCDNCGSCRSVCHVPHVLESTGKGVEKYITHIDCTMCGRCIDVCHNDTLTYKSRLKKLV
ncbi:ferredoxin-type protein, NapH/MauN family [Denitrovibrio acetiphilus DSM 12809]|uniref:Ferredoxin-type protein, NapH/MauN family n=1 Tax=Denitrovibrio acetiphilus (strain DSM 12809 / NBRC 114555 / N2460) TaxID=522772 RepID=D4H679_DENA2|nr:NapH/MauN family ferredoxin-type protein [Denitrovibrio acetiphilus]ADD67725.1 ferredoxin-type protein, NapH/MauN family [Denitrovibrio acetiphilus DSM 12809]